LDGFACITDEGSLIGLITYMIHGVSCEIISLDSTIENKGIGSALIEKVEELALNMQCSHVKLVTTNDNLHSLGFYQRRGYRLAGLVVDSVRKAREVKQEIPLVLTPEYPSMRIAAFTNVEL
jgi:ribosomal protein S18 acetylase RimI-like enzyme